MQANVSELNVDFLKAVCFNCGCTFPVKREEYRRTVKNAWGRGTLVPVCPECWGKLAVLPPPYLWREGYFPFFQAVENGGLHLIQPEAV